MRRRVSARLIPYRNAGIPKNIDGNNRPMRRNLWAGEKLSRAMNMQQQYESLTEKTSPAGCQIEGLIDELERAVALISRLDEINYRRVINGSSVGAQFRHDLDMVRTLIAGIESGRLDYGNRERDHRIEADPKFAVEKYLDLIRKLRTVYERDLGKSVVVRSEIDRETWLPSGVGREVEFVHSHTVHHHALIAEKLAAIGIPVVEDFGVAPSTIEYRARIAA